MPSYHAAGASKIYRRKTFESIGGLVSSQGWDTVDEIKAMYRGWVTTHFREARFLHLKDEGAPWGECIPIGSTAGFIISPGGTAFLSGKKQYKEWFLGSRRLSPG